MNEMKKILVLGGVDFLGSNLDGLLPKYDFQSSSDFMKMRHQ